MRVRCFSFFLVAFLALLIGGCATSVHSLYPPEDRGLRQVPSISPYPRLKQQIDALLPDSLFPPSNVGLMVRSMNTGEILYDLNSRLLFTPASNEKLFTTAAALSTLGESFQFRTRVFIDSLNGGRIIIKGSGDPMLSTKDIDSIAGVIAPLLTSRPSWTVTGDVSYFDDLYFGAGWMWDDESDASGMLLTPLSVNSNIVKLHVAPGQGPGDTVSVVVDPPTGYVSVQNHATVTTDTLAPPLSIVRRWRERSNVIDLNGFMLPGSRTKKEEITVWQPERYALTLLKESLERRKILVTSVTVDTLSNSAHEIFCFSRPIDSVVVFMNKESDNLSAENLLKTIGAESGGRPGSAEKGIVRIHAMLSQWGVDTAGVVIADGSGVSRYNLTSAATIIQLLSGMRNEHFGLFVRSLPVAGRDGTLSSRMRGTPAEGNLRAKTGTVSGVSSLSGYVTDADGDLLAFAMLMQNFPSKAKTYRMVQDSIGVALSTLTLR